MSGLKATWLYMCDRSGCFANGFVCAEGHILKSSLYLNLKVITNGWANVKSKRESYKKKKKVFIVWK